MSFLVPLDLADIGNTILTPFYWAVSGLLVLFHNMLSPILGFDSGVTWTLAIILLTAMVRTIIIPVYMKQIHSTRAMQSLQPQVTALREKYGSDKERLAKEQQRLYEEAGVNPMASCLPALAQMPIFLGLFWVLNGAARGNPKGAWLVERPELVQSLQNASIFGAKLSGRVWPIEVFGPTQVLGLVLVVTMTISLFIQQFLMMRRNMQPAALEGPLGQQQKMMLWMFPMMYAFGGVSIPIGVLIYWLTSNLWTLVQQLYVIRNHPTPGTPAYMEWEDRIIAKGKDPRELEKAWMDKARSKRRPATNPNPPVSAAAGAAVPTVQRQNIESRQIVRRDASGNREVIQRQQPRTSPRSKRKKG